MSLQRVQRILLLTLGYVAVIHVAYLASLLVRYDGAIPPRYMTGYLRVAPVFTALSLLGFLLSGLFHGVWRYASTVTAFQVFKGVTLSAAALALIMFFSPVLLFPRSLIILVWLWELVLLGGLRFAWRISSERLLEPEPRRYVRVLVVGADHAGVHLIQEMRRGGEQGERLRPIGFVDNDTRLAGSTIEGVKVVGAIADLPRLIPEKRIEMVVISDSGMPGRVVREIASFCAEASVVVKTVPAFSSLQHGKTALSQIRDVQIEDLLGREPVQLDLNEVGQFLRSQRILVTGAGGSIGAELARQSASESPAELILLDHSENGLYYVQNEIAALHPTVPLHAVVADIRDADGMRLAFERYRPTVVFHAAAHKHVPLLESAPREAVFNNVIGTRHLVEAAERAGVGKFVFISTDKAVNPSSVMGASKRVGEMILQARSQRSKTRFIAVRFGNVLGSEGSVVPLFQRQIQRGGPITVTHPETRRYFMTIPEAVKLVIQAGAIGKGGEVMLLDMGEQVRILDLARQLIRLSGLREGHDIQIVFTGLRPGEKLYEELHSDEERMRMTRNQRILVWDLDARDETSLRRDVDELERIARTGDAAAIKDALHRIVPEYRERVPDGGQAAPATPVVSLPASATPAPRITEAPRWNSLRTLIEGGVALALLALSMPLWGLLWIEAQRTGRGSFLIREQRIGRTRRGGPRHESQTAPDGIERRRRDLMGERIDCLRFRDDLGRVSRWVWRRRLDRLPFLLNVVRGEMALVGPNPERDEVVARCQSTPDYERRFRVLPGVTGLAQISGCGADDLESIRRRVQYDLHYVDHQSLLLDLRTLIRTIGVLAGAPRREAGSNRPPVDSTSALKGATH